MKGGSANANGHEAGIYILDYGAGNVLSIVNAVQSLGFAFSWISSPEDFTRAKVST